MGAPSFSPDPDPIASRRRLIDRLFSTAVVAEDRPDLVRTKRLFTAGVWASLFTSIISVYQMISFDAPWAAVALTMPIVAALVTLVAMWHSPGSFPAVMHVMAAGSMVATTAMIVLFGGVYESASNTMWSILVVIAAVAIFADRRSHFWLAVFVIGTLGAAALSSVLEPLYGAVPNREYLSLFNLLVVGAFIYVVLYHFVRQSVRLYKQTETLLHNILPVPIADRLRESESRIADEYPSASILFADVAGFTPLAAEMKPAEVVELLNAVFTTFDDLVADRDLEKIKTIGDAYMVAAGVPIPRDDHAGAICDLALDMAERLRTYEFAGRHIEMRIGIASGPVTAGIIGRQKFSYDLWGDTVNLASRMETSGLPGRIQITGATREMAGGRFVTDERGLIDVKGRGQLRSWFLLGRREVE